MGTLRFNILIIIKVIEFVILILKGKLLIFNFLESILISWNNTLFQ